MSKSNNDTRMLLIKCAGELFAEHGYDKVSTRAIAEKASVKLSGIHYHFGSKEKLYREVCLYAFQNRRPTEFCEICDENPDLLKTREGLAEIVRMMVLRSFENLFDPAIPEWERTIIIREIVTPGPTMQQVVETGLKPEMTKAYEIYALINPAASWAEASAWIDLFYGQLVLYNTARSTLELARGGGFFDRDFYLTAAKKIARAMILEAELPLPQGLSL